jgi:microcompartment protein CcmL/EutN
MELKAIAMVELNSIAKGVHAADEMLKTSDVELVMAQPICAGKYMALVVGKEVAGEFLVDDFVIPNVHTAVFPALTATTRIRDIDSLAVIETFSVASAIMAADAAVKAAAVDIIEIRCATGLGGKSFLYLTGDVSSVNSAVEAGIDVLRDTGLILSHVVIPSPSRAIGRCIL